MLKQLLSLSALSVSSLILATSASAASLVNGSFETSTSPGGFTQINSPNNGVDIANWNVSGGSVDLIGTFWTPSNGARSIDLSGSTAGTLSTLVTITPADVGVLTNLLFDLATNGPGPKSLSVGLAGFATQNYTGIGTAAPALVTDWRTNVYSFTPTLSDVGLRTLTFTSLEASAQGAALDNVRFETQPPNQTIPFEFSPLSGLVLIGLGFGVSKFAKKSAKQ